MTERYCEVKLFSGKNKTLQAVGYDSKARFIVRREIDDAMSSLQEQGILPLGSIVLVTVEISDQDDSGVVVEYEGKQYAIVPAKLLDWS